MSAELERLVGFLVDICDGDGGRVMAPYLDCHICKTPLKLTADRERKVLCAKCPRDPGHLDWDSDYSRLPAWFDDYEKLNIS